MALLLSLAVLVAALVLASDVLAPRASRPPTVTPKLSACCVPACVACTATAPSGSSVPSPMLARTCAVFSLCATVALAPTSVPPPEAEPAALTVLPASSLATTASVPPASKVTLLPTLASV